MLVDHIGAKSGTRRVAADSERDRLWAEFVAFFPGYEFFREHARGPEIPIVVFDAR